VKILQVVPTYLPATRYGGPIYSVHGLSKALARRGHDVHVFTTSVDGDRDSDVPLSQPVALDGVTVHYFPSRRLRRIYHSEELRRALEKEIAGFDVVHLHSVFLQPTLLAARAASRRRVPYVVSPRGMLVRELIERKSRLLKLLWIALFERRTLREAAAVHYTTIAERDDARALGFRVRREVVIANGVEPPAPGGGPDGREPFLLFLGRLNWKKRPELLIDALARLPDAWRAVFAGADDEGYSEIIIDSARRAGLAHRISIEGEVHGARKDELLRKASLLVLPSISENFGNVVLEAAAVATPSLVSEGVGIASIFGAHEAAFVATEELPIGDQIAAAALSPRRAQIGSAARELAVRDFSWEAVAERMESMYMEISTERRA
jgi:glycosyltransferase involved in cell wall biosynthesis